MNRKIRQVYPPALAYLPSIRLGLVEFYNAQADGDLVHFYIASEAAHPDGYIENGQRTVTVTRKTWDAMVAAQEVKS